MAQKGTQFRTFTTAPTVAEVQAVLTDWNFPRELEVSTKLANEFTRQPFSALLARFKNFTKTFALEFGDTYWMRAPIVTDSDVASRIREAAMLANAMGFTLVVERAPFVEASPPEYVVFRRRQTDRPLLVTFLLDEVEHWLEHEARGRTFTTPMRDGEPTEDWAKKLDPDAAPTGDPVQLTANRGHAYGAPEDNHAATADFFTVWLARKYGGTPNALDREDTVAFNVLQKLSRAANSFKADNWHDIQGYAQNALDMPGGGRSVSSAPPGYVSPLEANLLAVTGIDLATPRYTTVREAQERFEAIAQADGDGGYPHE